MQCILTEGFGTLGVLEPDPLGRPRPFLAGEGAGASPPASWKKEFNEISNPDIPATLWNTLNAMAINT